jgi:hypothetical protein
MPGTSDSYRFAFTSDPSQRPLTFTLSGNSDALTKFLREKLEQPGVLSQIMSEVASLALPFWSACRSPRTNSDC